MTKAEMQERIEMIREELPCWMPGFGATTWNRRDKAQHAKLTAELRDLETQMES